jgi:hypothetical protein
MSISTSRHRGRLGPHKMHRHDSTRVVADVHSRMMQSRHSYRLWTAERATRRELEQWREELPARKGRFPRFGGHCSKTAAFSRPGLSGRGGRP